MFLRPIFMNDFPIHVGFCAPSRAIQNISTAALAKLFFTDRGAQVSFDDTVFLNEKQFAGSDELRLEGLMSMINDPEIDLVMPIRGGYGLSRLLDKIDFEAVAAKNKVLCGYSDFTAFNLAYLAKTGKVSYQGPCGTDFVDQDEALTIESLHNALFSSQWHLKFPSAQVKPLQLNGTLWGGNLSMMISLLGTPYFPQIKDGILFIEDGNERAYRLERMLLQLDMAGILKQQKAIILGNFRDADPAHPQPNDYLFADCIKFIQSRVPNCPIIPGLPFGHTPRKVTLPVGAKVQLYTQKGYVYLSTQDHPRIIPRR